MTSLTESQETFYSDQSVVVSSQSFTTSTNLITAISETPFELTTGDNLFSHELTTFNDNNSLNSTSSLTDNFSIATANYLAESTTYYSNHINATISYNTNGLYFTTSKIPYEDTSSYKELFTYYNHTETTKIVYDFDDSSTIINNDNSFTEIIQITNSTQTAIINSNTSISIQQSSTTTSDKTNEYNEIQKAKIELVKILVPIFSVILGFAFISFIIYIFYIKGKPRFLIRLFRRNYTNVVQPS